MGRVPSHPIQSFLTRAVLSFKVLGPRGPRLRRVSFPGCRGCLGTERTPRSHLAKRSGVRNKNHRTSGPFPRRRCYRFCKLIDRKGSSPRKLLQSHSVSFEHLLRLGHHCGDVRVNSRYYVGRLRYEFPIPHTPEDGELEQSLVHRSQCRNRRDFMRPNPIRVYTRTRWQTDSGVLRLLTRMLIISGPGRTPHSTQAPRSHRGGTLWHPDLLTRSLCALVGQALLTELAASGHDLAEFVPIIVIHPQALTESLWDSATDNIIPAS